MTIDKFEQKNEDSSKKYKTAWYDKCMPKMRDNFSHYIFTERQAEHRGIRMSTRAYEKGIEIGKYKNITSAHIAIINRVVSVMGIDGTISYNQIVIKKKRRLEDEQPVHTHSLGSGRNYYKSYDTFIFEGEEGYKVIYNAAKIYRESCLRHKIIPDTFVVNKLFGVEDYNQLDYDLETAEKIKKKNKEESFEKDYEWALASTKLVYFSVFQYEDYESEVRNKKGYIEDTYRVKLYLGSRDSFIVQSNNKNSVASAAEYIFYSIGIEYYKHSVFSIGGECTHINDEFLSKKKDALYKWAECLLRMDYYCLLEISSKQKDILRTDSFKIANQISSDCKVKIVIGKGLLVQSYKKDNLIDAMNKIQETLKCKLDYSIEFFLYYL